MFSLSSFRLHPLLQLVGLSTNPSVTAQRQRRGLQRETSILYLYDLVLRAIGRILDVHHKIVYLWIVQAVEQLPKNILNTKVCSVIEIDELRSFFAEKITNASSV